MARAVPQVFTVAPGQNFATLIVRGLMERRLIDLDFTDNPAAIADLVIYVPTQRVRRILEAAFAEAFAPRPAILPRIRPLAEPGDPLDRLFADGLPGGLTDFAQATTRVINPMARRFGLLPLIEAWRGLLRKAASGDAANPALFAADSYLPGAAASIRESLALSDALGRLIDEMRIAGVPLGSLESTAPPGYDSSLFDTYWEKTREFLRIAARYWPDELERLHARDEMDVRLDAIETEARRLEKSDPKTPMLVIGSTGSVTATAHLMRAVSRLDFGAVVLPGLDLGLDARGWEAVASETATLATRFAHPQAALKRVLADIGIPRDAIRLVDAETAAEAARNRAISEALRPAESVDDWRETLATLDMAIALDGITLIDAADEREEALAIALLMRETLATEDATIAFVTADRGLARRVTTEMARWNVEIEDSAGASLAERPAGVFLQLLLRAATERDGGSVLALLRHPAARIGFSADDIEALTDALEILVFRGRHFSPALALTGRVRHALALNDTHPHAAATRISPAIRARLPELAAALEAAFAPCAPDAPVRPISEFALELIEILMRLSADETGTSALDPDPDAATLVEMLRDIGTHGETCRIAPAALAGAMDVFLSERIVPPTRKGHSRAAILGPLEARLVTADRVIVGGLNEGSFPPVAEEDAFLNRAMRLDLGLQPPERRIGQSAHDFAMLAGNREVIFTRAARAGGQPAIPSRFLRRLEAFAGKDHWKAVAARGTRILRLARLIDEPAHYAPIAAPEPVPAAPRIPERLSITEIETLRRDPYAIYARHILRLAPLEPIEPELDGRERGTLIHACLEAYARTEPPEDPELAAQHLREIGTELFEEIRHESELYHFWWQRFCAIIPDFVAFDRDRRAAGHRILTEVRGKFPLELATGETVTISGKADRFEIDAAGRLAILDYKSGMPPSTAIVVRGLAPQLPITAALAMRGAFGPVSAPAGISEIAHIPIGGQKALAPVAVIPKTMTLDALIDANWQRLEHELTAFARGDTAYRSRLAPAARDRDGDYDHLARVREWHATGGISEANEEGEGASPDSPEGSE